MMSDKERIEELEKQVKEMRDILFGTNDDVRFKAKVRSNVVGVTATNQKPYIVTANGVRYEITTTTKLN